MLVLHEHLYLKSTQLLWLSLLINDGGWCFLHYSDSLRLFYCEVFDLDIMIGCDRLEEDIHMGKLLLDRIA